MFKSKCPSCKEKFWSPLVSVRGKAKSCPYCHQELKLNKTSKVLNLIWLLIIAPILIFLILIGWSGVTESMKWGVILTVITYLVIQVKFIKYEIPNDKNKT